MFEGETDPQVTADLARLEVRHQVRYGHMFVAMLVK